MQALSSEKIATSRLKQDVRRTPRLPMIIGNVNCVMPLSKRLRRKGGAKRLKQYIEISYSEMSLTYLVLFSKIKCQVNFRVHLL